jgi:hypothetical protein
MQKVTFTLYYGDIVTQSIYQTTPSLALDVERTQQMLRQQGMDGVGELCLTLLT